MEAVEDVWGKDQNSFGVFVVYIVVNSKWLKCLIKTVQKKKETPLESEKLFNIVLNEYKFNRK